MHNSTNDSRHSPSIDADLTMTMSNVTCKKLFVTEALFHQVYFLRFLG